MKHFLKDYLMHYKTEKIIFPKKGRLITFLKNKYTNLSNRPYSMHYKKEMSITKSNSSNQYLKPSEIINKIINQKKNIKPNSVRNIYRNPKKNDLYINNMINNEKIQSELKKNGNSIFFTSLKKNPKSIQNKYRLKSSFSQIDLYSKQNLEKHKKVNLFEIYKRSNYYNVIIMASNIKRYKLNSLTKNDVNKDEFKNLCINNSNKNYDNLKKENIYYSSSNYSNTFKDNNFFKSILASFD